jgi:hypothetical protein
MTTPHNNPVIGEMLGIAELWPCQPGRGAMTDQVDFKLDALVANVRDLIKSGVSGEEATARKLEINDQCQELLEAWLSERVVDIQHYREAEAALERLREAVKKECDKGTTNWRMVSRLRPKKGGG